MTIAEIIDAKNAETENMFGTDFAGYYNISDAEAARIAKRATSLQEFEAIWQNEIWWADEK